MSPSDEHLVQAEIATDGPQRRPAAAGLKPQLNLPVVEAELVDRGQRSAAHPLRFGLRALLALTAICSAQFAFMSYVGTLPGLLVTALLSGACLAALLVGPLVMGRRARAAWMGSLDQLAIRLAMAIALLLIGAMLAGGGLAIHYQVSSMRLARKVQRHIGLSARDEQILETDDDGLQTGRHAIFVRHVTPGGACHEAGFLKGDVILTEMRPLEYYRMLDENRGNAVTVEVASGAVGSVLIPVEDCPQRSLELQIPP